MLEKRKRNLGRYLVISQASIYGFIILHAALWHVFGIRILSKLCPFTFGTHVWNFEFNFAVLFWFLVLASTLIVGRAFCAWGCMSGAYQDFVFRITKKGKRRRITVARRWVERAMVFAILISTLIKGTNDNWPTLFWFLIGVSALGTLIWSIGPSRHDDRHFDKLATLPKYVWITQYLGGIVYWWITLNVLDKGISFAFEKVGVLDNVAWSDELILAALIAIGIVFVEKRVFCKYLCPIGMLLRITSSIPFPIKYRVGKTSGRCVECGLCDKACMMDLKPQEELREYGYVKNANCINCLACVSKCPNDAIDLIRIGHPTIKAGVGCCDRTKVAPR